MIEYANHGLEKEIDSVYLESSTWADDGCLWDEDSAEYWDISIELRINSKRKRKTRKLDTKLGNM